MHANISSIFTIKTLHYNWNGLFSVHTPIRRFEKTKDNDDEVVVSEEGKPRNRARLLLDEHRRKKASLVQSDNYRLTKHILPTTNIVERFFSRAKLALTDHRKRMTPRHI